MLAPNYVDWVIGRESGGNPNAQNPRSSAFGLGQFIDSTWADMARRYPNEITMDGRKDPAQQRRATELYGQQNAEFLKSNGIEPTNENVYLAHHFGPGAALKMLKGDMTSPVNSFVGPEVMQANPNLAAQSVTDLQNKWKAEQGLQSNPQVAQVQNSAAPPQPQGGMQQVVPPSTSASRGPGLFSDPAGWWNSERSGRDISNLGISLMAMSNPEAAKVLLAQQQGQGGNAFDSHIDSNGNIIRVNKRTGEVLTARSPNFQVKVPEGALKNADTNAKAAGGSAWIASEAAQVLRDIKSGALDLGAGKNLVNYGRNVTGWDSENSEAYARYQRFITRMQNETLLQAKGVQTEGDAYRAIQQFIAGGGNYNSKVMAESLEDVIRKAEQDIGRSKAGLEAHKATYGPQSFQHLDERFTQYGETVKKSLQDAQDARKRFTEQAKTPAGKPAMPQGQNVTKTGIPWAFGN